ncbi:hypothetical protein HK405_001244, partial [Cladochytrium tenue]
AFASSGSVPGTRLPTLGATLATAAVRKQHVRVFASESPAVASATRPHPMTVRLLPSASAETRGGQPSAAAVPSRPPVYEGALRRWIGGFRVMSWAYTGVFAAVAPAVLGADSHVVALAGFGGGAAM